MSALNDQIGGSHYKDMAIQPMEYSMLNKLDACQHTAIKYVTRFREKGGIQDLRKAIHVIEMLIEFEEQAAHEAAMHAEINTQIAEIEEMRKCICIGPGPAYLEGRMLRCAECEGLLAEL